MVVSAYHQVQLRVEGREEIKRIWDIQKTPQSGAGTKDDAYFLRPIWYFDPWYRLSEFQCLEFSFAVIGTAGVCNAAQSSPFHLR